MACLVGDHYTIFEMAVQRKKLNGEGEVAIFSTRRWDHISS